MNLEELRTEIDGIDDQLVPLFVRRMELSGKIAEQKKEANRPVNDPERERSLLNRVSAVAGEEFESQTRVLYNLILSLSRARQSHLMGDDSALVRQIEDTIAQTPPVFPERGAVGCQGIEGAYSQLACEKLFASPGILYFNTFEGVCSAVEKGLCRYGILPVENSTAGSVNQIYDLMLRYNFYIVRSTRVHVSHSLLAKKGARLEEIREIYSHEQAINQCGQFLQSLPNVRSHICENTAVAARFVSQSDRRDIAAISSPNCAALYGLDTILESIQDVDNNYTRFICISKTPEIYPGANRTSLMLVLPHKPGALYGILSEFYVYGINLLKLESRPIPGRDFEFMFYFDIDIPVYSPKFADLLSHLAAMADRMQYLGSYTEVV